MAAEDALNAGDFEDRLKALQGRPSGKMTKEVFDAIL